MLESALLQRIDERSRDLAQAGGPVLVGPGDDCALIAPSAGPLLLTVDQLIEHRHFHGPILGSGRPAGGPSGTPVDLVARKAVARSVSDIAAMGGRPRWALATGALAKDFPQPLAEELVDALAAWARHWGCPLVGGDLAALDPGQPAVLTVTIGGEPDAARGAVLRSGARPGDEVWLTGALGGSLASGRHLTFEPRVREGAFLAELLADRLHAMIDLSDGLGRDAGRVARASGVRIALDGPRVPLHAGLGQSALGDGEDYELLFVVDARAAGAVPPVCPATGTPLTRIGRVEAGEGCVLLDAQGRLADIRELGWDH